MVVRKQDEMVDRLTATAITTRKEKQQLKTEDVVSMDIKMLTAGKQKYAESV